MYRLGNKIIGVIRQEGIAVFVRLVLNDIINFFILPYCLFKVCHFKSCDDLYKSIEFAFSLCKGYIRPVQNKSEIFNFLTIVKKTRPKYIVEIGTAYGGTLFLFTKIASKDAHIISVDKQNWKGRGGYPTWKIPFFKSFALPRQEIYLLPTDSHTKKTFEEIKTILNSNKIDLLFIDGDHNYEGVKLDFEMYAPLVRKNGLIAFHDIGVEFRGVNKFWTEIKSKYRQIEIAGCAKPNTGLIEMH